MKETLNKILDFFGFLSENQKLSLTNLAVIIFIVITSFKSLFGGLDITWGTWLVWKVQEVDIANTLPLLFSLINYNQKRVEANKMKLNEGKTSNEVSN